MRNDTLRWLRLGFLLATLLLWGCQPSEVKLAEINGTIYITLDDLKEDPRFKELLDKKIEDKLIQLECQERNITVSPEEVDKRVQNLAKSFGGEKVLKQLLANQGITEDYMKKIIYQSILEEKFFNSVITVSEDEARAYFNANLKTYKKYYANKLNMKEEEVSFDNPKVRETFMNDYKQALIHNPAKRKSIIEKLKSKYHVVNFITGESYLPNAQPEAPALKLTPGKKEANVPAVKKKSRERPPKVERKNPKEKKVNPKTNVEKSENPKNEKTSTGQKKGNEENYQRKGKSGKEKK